MSTDALEQAILSGATASQPTSIRPDSPLNTDDELGSDLEDGLPEPADYGLEVAGSQGSSRGQGKGYQTGVKGVIQDHKDSAFRNRQLHQAQSRQQNKYLLSKAFQAQTHDEEQLARKHEQALKEKRESGVHDRYQMTHTDTEQDSEEEEARRRWKEKRIQQFKRQSSSQLSEEDHSSSDEASRHHRSDLRSRGFTEALREVRPQGFLEQVDKPGWTIVLLYEPNVARCGPYMRALLSLSTTTRQNTTYIKARATLLGFSLISGPSNPTDASDSSDEDDGYGHYATGPARAAKRTDPDVVPAILVYKAGHLEETLIRPDLEITGGMQMGDESANQQIIVDGLKVMLQKKGVPT